MKIKDIYIEDFGYIYSKNGTINELANDESYPNKITHYGYTPKEEPNSQMIFNAKYVIMVHEEYK